MQEWTRGEVAKQRSQVDATTKYDMPPTSDGTYTVGVSLHRLIPDANHLEKLREAVLRSHGGEQRRTAVSTPLPRATPPSADERRGTGVPSSQRVLGVRLRILKNVGRRRPGVADTV